MSPSDTLFFAEMYSLVKKMEETIDEFDMKDRTLDRSAAASDVDKYQDAGDQEAEMKTMYSFNLQSREELNAIKDVMDTAYKDDDDDIDLDDLLGDLGISLN